MFESGLVLWYIPRGRKFHLIFLYWVFTRINSQGSVKTWEKLDKNKLLSIYILQSFLSLEYFKSTCSTLSLWLFQTQDISPVIKSNRYFLFSWPAIYIFCTILVVAVPAYASPAETGVGCLMILTAVPVYLLLLYPKTRIRGLGAVTSELYFICLYYFGGLMHQTF